MPCMQSQRCWLACKRVNLLLCPFARSLVSLLWLHEDLIRGTCIVTQPLFRKMHAAACIEKLNAVCCFILVASRRCAPDIQQSTHMVATVLRRLWQVSTGVVLALVTCRAWWLLYRRTRAVSVMGTCMNGEQRLLLSWCGVSKDAVTMYMHAASMCGPSTR